MSPYLNRTTGRYRLITYHNMGPGKPDLIETRDYEDGGEALDAYDALGMIKARLISMARGRVLEGPPVVASWG